VVDAIHGDTITCKFDADKVGISFLNSISENAKNDPEKRMKLTGNIIV